MQARTALTEMTAGTQNYKVLLAGVKGGFKTGARVGVWTLAFVGIEYGVTRLQLDAYKQGGVKEGSVQWTRLVAGSVAGLGIASGASLLCESGQAKGDRYSFAHCSFFADRLPGPVARRALLLGLITGSSVGALRDAQQLLSHRDTT